MQGLKVKYDRRSRARSKKCELYASDLQSRLLRTYLFRFPSPSFESIAHSEIVMTREIRDDSYIVNPCLVEGESMPCEHKQSTGHTSDRDTKWPQEIAGDRNEVDYRCSSYCMPVCALWLTQPTRPMRTQGEGS
jgi:hypothetical protein